MFTALLALQVLAAAPNADPFAFFQPSVVLSADDRRQLDRGEPIARVLPGKDHEVAVFAAVPVDIDGDRLVTWMRRIEELKKSSYVLAIGRFSDPPRIEDLAGLALDDEDVSEVRTCRPGSCALKLSASEMTQLRDAAAAAERDWKPAVQRAFRRAVLERVRMYLATGHIAAYEDQKRHVWPSTRFALLLDHSVFLTDHLPRFTEHLRGYPLTAAPDVESFVYWSKERLARKAIIGATHVSIVRSHDAGLPDALVAGKEIFATHYLNASLGLTAITRGESGAHTYLAYVNRSEVDMLGGMFGGLVRWFMQRRLKTEAADVLRGLRRRLEGGEPQAMETRGAPSPSPPRSEGLRGRAHTSGSRRDRAAGASLSSVIRNSEWRAMPAEASRAAPPASRSITHSASDTSPPRERKAIADSINWPPEVTTSSTRTRFLPEMSPPSASRHVP